MGIERRGEGGLRKTYVNIFNGMLEMKAEALDPNNPSIVKRTTSAGKELIVDKFDAITGHIVGLEYIKESKVGKRLQLKIVADKLYIIDMPYIGTKGWVSEYARTLLVRLGNVELDEEVRFAPYSFIPKDKNRKTEGVVLHQNGVKIGPDIDYEDIPKVSKSDGLEPGEVVYDPSSQTKWYHTLMLKLVAKLDDYMLGKPTNNTTLPGTNDIEYPEGGMAGSGQHVDTSNVPVMGMEDDEEFDDDLPF